MRRDTQGRDNNRSDQSQESLKEMEANEGLGGTYKPEGTETLCLQMEE